jgi:hypothetical protein
MNPSDKPDDYDRNHQGLSHPTQVSNLFVSKEIGIVQKGNALSLMMLF